MNLTDAGKEELALALLLLKDFKCDGKFNTDILIQILSLADHLGIRKEYDSMVSKVPPMRITERYPLSQEDIPRFPRE